MTTGAMSDEICPEICPEICLEICLEICPEICPEKTMGRHRRGTPRSRWPLMASDGL